MAGMGTGHSRAHPELRCVNQISHADVRDRVSCRTHQRRPQLAKSTIILVQTLHICSESNIVVIRNREHFTINIRGWYGDESSQGHAPELRCVSQIPHAGVRDRVSCRTRQRHPQLAKPTIIGPKHYKCVLNPHV